MAAQCYSRMCFAIYHYSAGEGGVPWSILRGEVNFDVLDGPTEIVVLKRSLANEVDYHAGLVWGNCPAGYPGMRNQY